MTQESSEDTNKDEDIKRSSCLLIILLNLLFIVSLMGYCTMKTSKAPRSYLEQALPSDAKIIEVEEEFGGLSGDYKLIAKIDMSADSFDVFIKSLGLPLDRDVEANSVDISGSMFPWWVEPKGNTLIYKDSGKDWLFKVFYQDGSAYYVDCAW